MFAAACSHLEPPLHSCLSLFDFAPYLNFPPPPYPFLYLVYFFVFALSRCQLSALPFRACIASFSASRCFLSSIIEMLALFFMALLSCSCKFARISPLDRFLFSCNLFLRLLISSFADSFCFGNPFLTLTSKCTSFFTHSIAFFLRFGFSQSLIIELLRSVLQALLSLFIRGARLEFSIGQVFILL